MAETYKVRVEFRANSGFTIPEDITVPLNSNIQWEITDMNTNQSGKRFNQSGLQFRLYFRDKSPFNWNIQSTNFQYPSPQNYSSGGMEYQLAPMTQMLAAGVAQEKGDFKYGVVVIDTANEETLYDEDPYIHVI